MTVAAGLENDQNFTNLTEQRTTPVDRICQRLFFENVRRTCIVGLQLFIDCILIRFDLFTIRLSDYIQFGKFTSNRDKVHFFRFSFLFEQLDKRQNTSSSI